MQPPTSSNKIAEKYNRIIIQTKCNDKQTECSICLNSIYMNSVTHLPCTHFFHTKCFNTAVRNKLYTCPLCRFDLTFQLKLLGISRTPTINEIYNNLFYTDDLFYTGDDYSFIQHMIDIINEETTMHIHYPNNNIHDISNQDIYSYALIYFYYL